MSQCYLRSYDYKANRRYGGKFSLVGAGIGLRSTLTHSEIQFSLRYGGVSVSATMEDGCNCVRFKKILYSNAKKWWSTVPLNLTDEQEDDMFDQAVLDTNVSMYQWDTWIARGMQGCLYYNGALKYDTLGVSFSFILPKWRVWRPSKTWVWCSEQCKELLFVAEPYFKILYEQGQVKRPDETTPQDLDHEVRLYLGDVE